MGYEEDEVHGKKSVEFLTPASTKYVKKFGMPALLTDGSVKNIPLQFIKKNNEIIDVLLSAASETDDSGDLASLTAVITDITELKLTQNALIQSEEMYRSLIENLPMKFAKRDVKSNKYTFWSKERYSLSLSDWLEMSDEDRNDHIHVDDVKMTMPAIKSWRKSPDQQSFSLEYRIKGKDGEFIWIECLFYKEYDENGKWITTNELSMDISGRKKAETELFAAENDFANLISMG